MLGSEDTSVEDTDLQCLYTAPNWYQSHVMDSNGTFIAYGARNMIQILSLDLKPIRMLSSHPKRVTTVCFAEENVLVSGCDGGVVITWSVDSGAMLSTLVRSPIPVVAVVFKRGQLFSGDEKGIVCVWEDLQKAKVFSRVQPFSEKIITMDCSDHSDSTLLALGYRMGTIAIMSVNGTEMTLMHTLKGHDMDIFRISWCKNDFPNIYTSISADLPTENLLVSTSRDRTIKLWDGFNNRIIRSLSYPPKLSSGRESNLNREQPWSSVVWTDAGIIASSATGDIACLEEITTEEGISELKWKSFDSPHAHSKKVFVICDLQNSSIITTSMDRETVLWQEGECVKVAHGLGGFAYGLDISPLAPNRIAVATGDNMVRIWEPYQNKVIQVWQSVRTKVMVVSWHPYKEGVVSFGTEEGRIGVYDVNSGSMSISGTHHEKPVYSMSWGYIPTKFPDDPLKTGLYSCGGEGIVFCHKPKEMGKAAVNVNSYLAAENKYKHQPPARSAVDWEFDAKLLAVGSSNGVIEIFKAPNLQLLTVFQYHTRIINKLRWGRNEGDRVVFKKSGAEGVTECPDVPPDQPQLLLGSCSDDNLICVQDLSSIAPSTTPILKSDQTLRGHTARITDIDWNPHNFSFLVSSCYDGTAQVWDVEQGTGVSSFRGHAGRVFSVRWSHTKLDCVYSGSDEFTVRQWRVSENVEKEPPKVNPLAPLHKPNNNRKKKRNAKKNVVISENKVEVVSVSDKVNTWRQSPDPPPCEVPELDCAATEPVKPLKSEPITVSVSDVKRKKGSRGKSLLPLASRRDHCSKTEQADQIVQIAHDMFADKPFRDESLTVADVGLYSSRSKTFELIAEERRNHTTENHHHQAALLGIWSSDISGTVDHAIQTKTVTESLLSVAVMCGLEKYKEAVRCYVAQLSASRDFVTAASYLLILGETRQAITMLVAEECFRDALAIAKMRLSPDDEMLKNIYETWAGKQEREMQFDSAIKCYLASGDARRAIMVMLRRKDVASLETTLKVAEIVQEEEMLPAIRAALEEARRLEENSITVEVVDEDPGVNGIDKITGLENGDRPLVEEFAQPSVLQNGS